MKIELLEKCGNKEAGTIFVVPATLGTSLIKKGVAKVWEEKPKKASKKESKTEE
jgi:hypothetical protein